MATHAPLDATEVRYEGKIDLSVKNNSHTIAFDLISNDSRGRKCKILEVGCSTGYFGRVLKEAGHEVWGIELSSVAAEKAKLVLDFIYVGTIEAFLEDALEQNISFEYIIFGDVLEHLPNPSDVLKACEAILAEDGAIVASIPNVAHLAVRLMLLEGRWDYSNLGIMDDTHLRFFTKNSIIHMFNEAGYTVRTLDHVRMPIESTGIRVNPALRKRVEPLLKDNEQDIFQYVLLAKKAVNIQEAVNKTQWHLNESIKVLCLLPDISSPLAKIRIIDPLRAWATYHGGATRFRNISEIRDMSDVIWADVIVFQREANIYVLHLINHIKSFNKKIIFDLDDLLTEVPEFLQAHHHHEKTKKMLVKAIGLSDVITVTNDRLRNELIKFNQEIAVIPNCSEPLLINQIDKHAGGPVDLLIASSDSIRVDFIIPLLFKLLGQTEVQFNIIGIGAPGKFISDAGLPISLHENMTHNEFKTFISMLKNPIGLIPLDNSKFSSCKSAIKFIDYSLCGVVSVCSSVSPYSDVVVHNETGLLINNDPNDWYGAIMKLAKEPDLRGDLARSAYKFCQGNYTLESAAELWKKLFDSMEINRNNPVSYSSTRYRKIFSLCFSYLIEPSTYSIAIEIFKRDGLLGLAKSFRRLVMRMMTIVKKYQR